MTNETNTRKQIEDGKRVLIREMIKNEVIFRKCGSEMTNCFTQMGKMPLVLFEAMVDAFDAGEHPDIFPPTVRKMLRDTCALMATTLKSFQSGALELEAASGPATLEAMANDIASMLKKIPTNQQPTNQETNDDKTQTKDQ